MSIAASNNPHPVEHTDAWLFDLYAEGEAMVLWFLATDGRRLRLVDDTFRPRVFVEGPPEAVARCLADLEARGEGTPDGVVHRADFWTGRPRRVHAFAVRRVEGWHRRLAKLALAHPGVAWHNADFTPEQVYGYEHNTFPLARCRVTFAGDRLLHLETRDDRWAIDYETPPLRTVLLDARGSLLGARPHLESVTLQSGEQSWTWDEGDFVLEGFQNRMNLLDPDVILTRGGDALVLPLLLTVAHRREFDLVLDRDPPAQARRVALDGRSFMSYGKILYQAPEYALRGRWHIDLDNSFMGSQAGLEGIFEVARLSRLPAQRISRRSIGTGITSVQLDLAWREGYLVPWKKTQPEAWKTAEQLLLTDRGGLVYAPRTGFYEDVVELDFVSMYPTIMARFNVSPETVNCACCDNARVPEIGYTICERREGLVSRVLGPVIDKRARFKARRGEARAAGDTETARQADRRQTALKWMLVCCFGYLGYRNARFGRIEAHEAVSAYARELLTRCREVCEDHGWAMLHANVDCVWIRKPGYRREEIDALRRAIDDATGLTIALEGVYRWIAFLPSRVMPDRPVPARLFGVFEDGSMKVRGIEARRHDTPAFLRRAQEEGLALLATARTYEECRALVPALHEMIAGWETLLWNHEVALDDLAFHTVLSRDPEAYRGHSRQALAARQATGAGLRLHAGQAIDYLLTSERDRDTDRRVCLLSLADATTTIDPAAYARLLRRTMNTLLLPFDAMLEEKKGAGSILTA